MESDLQSRASTAVATRRDMAVKLINQLHHLASIRANRLYSRRADRYDVNAGDSAWWLLRQQIEADRRKREVQ
jgi:hypothetical protein